MAGPADTFADASSDGYDSFMGRYSEPLAGRFADFVDLSAGMSALDVGCGPGALTTVLADRLGPASVTAIDPSPPFVAACARRCPDVDVRSGGAEEVPLPDGSFDAVLSQLVLHFVGEPARAGEEFRRVLRPRGLAAACVWDFTEEMEMLRHFWDAALTVDADAPDEARVLRFGREGELAAWLTDAGFVDVEEVDLHVSAEYSDFGELWAGFRHGIGPAGAYCRSLTDETRASVEREMFRRVGSPTGGFSLAATARAAKGRSPA